MITYQQMGRYVTAEPFRPFQVRMVSGRLFDVRHPEMVQVGRTTMTIYTFYSDNEEEAKQHQIEASLLLVESVEPLDVSARPQGVS